MITPVKHWSKRENLVRSMRQKLRFFWLSILICFCIFFALSCSPSGSDPLEIMKSGFTAHVSVSGYSIEFDAVLSLAPPSETGERDFDLRFISPESLCGIRLMRTGDGLSVLLGDDLFTETEFEKFRDLAMFSFIESMSAGAAVRSVLSVKGSDCGMPHIERLTAVSTRDFTVYIDPASGFPLKIERNDGVILNIKNFTPDKIA